MAAQNRRPWSQALQTIATLACALLVYYGLPLGLLETSFDVLGLAMVIIGVAGLSWLVLHTVRQYVAAPAETSNRLIGVLVVVYLVVIGFALMYYLIEVNVPGQFSGLETRTDALYYTVVTLGTVGFGDIVPIGQAARAVTIVQISFDLLLIGLLLGVAGSHVTKRMIESTNKEQ